MTWKRLGVASLIILALFLFPITRKLVLFVLPLGKGIDDAVVLAALVVSVIIWGGRWFIELKEDSARLLADMEHNTRTRLVFFVIVGTAVLVTLIMAWIFFSII